MDWQLVASLLLPLPYLHFWGSTGLPFQQQFKLLATKLCVIALEFVLDAIKNGDCSIVPRVVDSPTLFSLSNSVTWEVRWFISNAMNPSSTVLCIPPIEYYFFWFYLLWQLPQQKCPEVCEPMRSGLRTLSTGHVSPPPLARRTHIATCPLLSPLIERD